MTHPPAFSSEARNELIAEYSSDVIAVLDPGARILVVSPACRSVFGYEPGEIRGRSAYDFVHPDDFARAEQAHATALDGPSPVTSLPFRARHKEGQFVWVETTVRQIRDPDTGETLELHTSTRDITERKQAEDKLVLARELAVAIGEADTVEGGLRVVLRKICEKTGWALGQAWIREDTGTRLVCSAAWHALTDDVEPFRRASESLTFERGAGLPGRVWLGGDPLWLPDVRTEANPPRGEIAARVGLGAAMAVPVLARDEVVVVLEFFFQGPRSPDERLLDLVSAAAANLGSLVEHKRAEDQLRKSEARYRLLAENSTDVISVTDKHGVLRYVSPACRALTGHEPNELVGRSGYELVHPDDRAQVAEAHAEVVGNALPMTAPPYRVQRKDGSYVWIESTVRPILDPVTDETLEIQSSARDVSARKEAEQALRRANVELERSNLALEQFACDASHDLGEPINVMSHLATRLATGYGDRLDPDARRLIVSICDGLERMHMLIADLLEYSRVSREPPKRVPVDCGALLQETLALLAETIAEKQATVSYERLPTVNAYPTQLGQVFQNLLSNALKFAGDAPLRVHMSAARVEDRAWCFSVRDNGIGIDPQDVDRVFEMFRRLNPKDAYAGTGMGLSICKRIVERHGGRIWAEANPVGGSVFKFTIPDVPVTDESGDAPNGHQGGSQAKLLEHPPA